MVQKEFSHILRKMVNPIQYHKNQIQKNFGSVSKVSK